VKTRPIDPRAVAQAVAGAIVISADDCARSANPFYWHRAQPLLSAVIEAIGACGDKQLSIATESLLADPASVVAWQRVCDLVAALVEESPDASTIVALNQAAWAAESRTRLGYRVGAGYDRSARLDDNWRSWPGTPPPPAPGMPAVQVVVPFRDRSAEGIRARNLVACLAALNDQTAARADYSVIVVESDDEPRWQQTIARYADEYLFAPKRDAFNRSWAMNAGVVNAARQAPVVCLLDADALVDRDFVRRNAQRFLRQGTGALLPFRDLYYLDAAASATAIRERCLDGQPDARPEHLRGFVVHRAPGFCVWLRRDVFDAVNGMNERFQDWGREDIDFVLRVQLATAFDVYDDRTLHLFHPTSAHLEAGQTVNAHIPLLSWTPTEPVGQADRFRSEPGPSR
jgi:hypothetical protein